MKKSIVAGITMLASFVVGAPMAAYSQSQPQIAPNQQQNGAAMGDRMGPQGMGMMGAGRYDDDDGMSWRHDWMHDRMHQHGGMHNRPGFGGMPEGMMSRSPAERCQEHLARHMAMITYTVTKLDLTDEQRPLWDRLNAVLQDGAKRQLALCRSLQTTQQGSETTILDRVARAEQFLNTQLQMLPGASSIGAALSGAEPAAEGDRESHLPTRVIYQPFTAPRPSWPDRAALKVHEQYDLSALDP